MRRGSVMTHHPANTQSIQAWQHNVQYDKVRAIRTNRFQPTLTIHSSIHRKTFRTQLIGEVMEQCVFIFDD